MASTNGINIYPKKTVKILLKIVNFFSGNLILKNNIEIERDINKL